MLLFSIVGGVLAGCRPSAETDVVKMGLIAPFEGSRRDLGYTALAGARRAVAEANAAGGIHGRPIELVALNDEDEPAEARRQIAELAIDPAVLGVVAGGSAEAVAAALPAARDAGLPIALPLSWVDAPPDPCLARLAPPPEALVDAMLGRLRQRASIRQVVVHVQPPELSDLVVTALSAAGYRVLSDDDEADAWIVALDYEATAGAIQRAGGAPALMLNDLYVPLVEALTGEATSELIALAGDPEERAEEATRRLIDALRCAQQPTRPAVCRCLGD